MRLEEGAAVIYALATLHCKKKKLTENSDTEEAKTNNDMPMHDDIFVR